MTRAPKALSPGPLDKAGRSGATIRRTGVRVLLTPPAAEAGNGGQIARATKGAAAPPRRGFFRILFARPGTSLDRVLSGRPRQHSAPERVPRSGRRETAVRQPERRPGQEMQLPGHMDRGGSAREPKVRIATPVCAPARNDRRKQQSLRGSHRKHVPHKRGARPVRVRGDPPGPFLASFPSYFCVAPRKDGAGQGEQLPDYMGAKHGRTCGMQRETCLRRFESGRAYHARLGSGKPFQQPGRLFQRPPFAMGHGMSAEPRNRSGHGVAPGSCVGENPTFQENGLPRAASGPRNDKKRERIATAPPEASQ